LTRLRRIRHEAMIEIADAAQWYEEQRPALGAELLDELESTIREALEHLKTSAEQGGAARCASIGPSPARASTRCLCYASAMSAQITMEELEAAMAAAVDEDGNDIRLAAAVARMTPEQRRQSDENIRKWATAFEAGRRKLRDASDDVPA